MYLMILPCSIYILLFMILVKRRNRSPVSDLPIKLKVANSVRGVLSPLLSNLMLDVLDKELEGRGHRFVRYADDCNIYVRSWRAGERVMAGVEGFLAKRLKLVVNTAKSSVDRPARRSFLGFSFTPGAKPKRRVAPKSLARFKRRVRELTRCVRGASLSEVIKELSGYIVGWRGHFGHCETLAAMGRVDKWIRRRIRAIVWRQWKRGRTRYKALRRLGVGRDLAAQTAGSAHGPWRISMSPALSIALPNASLAKLGLVSCSRNQQLKSVEPPRTDPYAWWCGRGEIARFPPIPIVFFLFTRRNKA